ncbi:hypothetical protein DL95DRAFT_415955 [Leptodontidium sp. 2 PMI_412]|nr:hypothetical protein DL95DRAFT_415955 [Leptodontidium sp. 2 PMI_412]
MDNLVPTFWALYRAPPIRRSDARRHSLGERNISFTTDGDIDDIGNGDVPLAKKMIDESHKNVSKFANKSRKSKATGQVLFSVDVNGDSEPSQKRHYGQSPSFSEAIPGRDPAVEVIDLTIEVINLTGRCRALHYLLKCPWAGLRLSLAHVLCGECLLGNIQEQERESSSIIKDVWCPKSDHFDKGKQEACQIFGLECAICYTSSANEIDQGAP